MLTTTYAIVEKRTQDTKENKVTTVAAAVGEKAHLRPMKNEESSLHNLNHSQFIFG